MTPKGRAAGAEALAETDAPARSGEAARGKAAARVPAPSLRIRAYEEIKRRIITLDYAPGEPITSTSFPSAPKTMVGAIELRGRFPPSIRVATFG